MSQSAESIAKSSTVILHTFDSLENPVLFSLSSLLDPLVLAVSPLHLLADRILSHGHDQDRDRGCNLWREESECLRWLDSKDPDSVLYVNFGSLVILSLDQLAEIAVGLALSGHQFLLSIRPHLVAGVSGAPTGVLVGVGGEGFGRERVPPGGSVGPCGGRGIPDALRVELDARKHLRGEGDGLLALLFRPADELSILLQRVGNRDGDRCRLRGDEGGGEGVDGRREKEHDEEESGGVEEGGGGGGSSRRFISQKLG